MKAWCLLLGLWMLAAEGEAAERVALVIGNDGYRSFAPLAQAVNDADRVAGTLEALPVPFSVTRRADADRLQMQRAVEQFSNRLAEGTGDVALFYYAGHAVSHNGDVWLLPVDAQVQQASDIEAMGWSLRWLSGKLQRGNWKATVVVLDACRNALFAVGKEPPGLRGEALARGLIPIPQIKGLMVAYATAAGEVAREDTDRGGYYTQRLVANLKMPGLKLQDVFNATALEVERQTRQRPELMMTAMEEIYLAGHGVVTKLSNPSDAPPAVSTPDQETVVWQFTESVGTEAAYRAYLAEYPGGQFAAQARLKVHSASATSNSESSLHASSERFRSFGDEIHDDLLKLIWRAPKNTGGLTWRDARRACGQIGDDWDLPNKEQLYSFSLAAPIPLRGDFYWTIDIPAPGQGGVLNINYSSNPVTPNRGSVIRAMCVTRMH